jgi:uncharacterized membrane protein YqgA involved in biofilm formation
VFTGLGTIINVIAIIVGSGIGVLSGSRLSDHARGVVTDGLGLVVGVAAFSSAVAITDKALVDAVGRGWPTLVVLGALAIGGLIGAGLRIEVRLERLGESIRSRFAGHGESRFVEGFVTASLVFVVGPLAILGGISDGVGTGIDQLILKSSLDFFASIAFAATMGWGVAVSALPVGIYQALWTIVGVVSGNALPDYAISAMTATGGLLIMGIALRILRIRQIPIGDLLPAVAIAPLLAGLVAALR